MANSIAVMTIISQGEVGQLEPTRLCGWASSLRAVVPALVNGQAQACPTELAPAGRSACSSGVSMWTEVPPLGPLSIHMR